MELEDRFIHCASFSIFNSKKISANKDNTKYTYGVTSTSQYQGTPDVKWQSIVYIKDTQQQWTHGQLYGMCSPDWEAEYGQNGYIKNKPFGIDLVHTEDITSADLSDGSSYEIHLYNAYDGDILYYEQDYNMEIELLPLKVGAKIHIDSVNYLEVEYFDNFNIQCHTVLPDPAGLSDYTLNIYRVRKLDDVYIPDSVIKTTEQTLSYNEQKQAISNIGLYNEVDYDTLKKLRDNSELKPGCQYRIIDYITTTSQPNTQSAGHQFDIIVTADSENTLNEKARAIYHEDDSYFSSMGVDMNAWQIWYCLDNDTERFGWAGGTDVIGYFDDGGDLLVAKRNYRYPPFTTPCGQYVFYPIEPIYVGDECYYVSKNIIDGDTQLVHVDLYEMYNRVGIIGSITRNENGEVNFEDYSSGTTYIINESSKCVINEECYYYLMHESASTSYLYIKENSLGDINENSKAYGIYDWSTDIDYMLSYVLDHTEEVPLGKGVIYRMIDEWGNDCPYDFKNIMFKRLAITDCQQAQDFVVDSEDNYYGIYYGAIALDGINYNNYAIFGENFVWAYTFTLKDLASDVLYDYTTLNSIGLKNDESFDIVCRNNVIKEYRDMYLGVSGQRATWLNNIVMFNVYTDISSRDWAGEYSLCNDNKFENNCETITLGVNNWSNTFGENCRYNIFGSECDRNILRELCFSNYLCNGCTQNTFGYVCVDNTLGPNCTFNIFGERCSTNSFFYSCSHNTIGKECHFNRFGYDCSYNNFGDACESNFFSSDCSFNNFCTHCVGNEFGSYYKLFTLGSNVKHVKFVNNETGSFAYQVQNYKVSSDLQGLYNNKLNVPVSRNRNYETIIGRDSTGDVVQYCNADMYDITTWVMLS